MARTETVIALLASHIDAYHRCKITNNGEWLNRHADAVGQLCKDILPSGSGIDSGSTIDLDACSAEKIVIQADFHHMDDSGTYDGWTEHKVTARPSFIGGLSLSVSGRNRNDIKDYLAETFNYILTRTVTQDWDEERARYTYEHIDDCIGA